ncbi:MAG: M23 family metallopeptidase [Spirochaetaceae bacterium]|nr:MAG: M23 family metallopeptidase [Spirochaetaceae bacterium]
MTPQRRRHLAMVMVALVAGLFAVLVLVFAGREDPPDFLRAGPFDSHRSYARALTLHGLDRSAVGARWLDASTRPFVDGKRTLAPFTETVYLDALLAPAVGYEFAVTLGQRIDVTIDTDLRGYFVDLFLVEGESGDRLIRTNPRLPDPILSWIVEDQEVISFEPRETGWYLLRIQPRLMEGGELTVTVAADASLAWPVVGTDRRRIWSFFGDSRAGGARVHHGVDIFAPRGTPLVAISPSTVMRVGERNLGGNIITLHDRDRELMIYYAHLDEQLANQGDLVGPGDVIGTVGNTGNAITTPPHLHLGIYQTHWRRPVDPWYFIVPPDRTPEPVWRIEYPIGSWVEVAGAPVALMRYPAARSGVVQSPARFDAVGAPIRAEEIAPSRIGAGEPTTAEIGRGTPVRVIGATRSFYLVEVPTGERGYLSRTAVSRIVHPTTQLTAGEPIEVFARPDRTGDVVAVLQPGAAVAVHARWQGRYGLVFRENGRAGWIALPTDGLSSLSRDRSTGGSPASPQRSGPASPSQSPG